MQRSWKRSDAISTSSAQARVQGRQTLPKEFRINHNEMDALHRGYPWTVEELIESALEYGLDIEESERLAAALLPLINDPRGLRVALQEREPAVAERIGKLRRH